MRLSELTNKQVVHCKTEQEAERICEMMDRMGKVWSDGHSYKFRTNWDRYNGQTCYLVVNNTYCSAEYFEKDGCEIISSTMFKEEISPFLLF